MDAHIYDLTIGLEGDSPADHESLARAATALNIIWPADYAGFMAERDGGEGFVGDAYLSLWPAGELADLNQDYCLAEFAPDLVAFGSDGGGECFAFDRRSSPPSIVMVPFVGLDKPSHVGATFVELLERMRGGRLFAPPTGDISAR